MVAHHKHLCTPILHGSFVELQGTAIEPARAGLFVVVEPEPNVFELADLGVILTPPEIDDVGYPQGPKLLGVAPRHYGASER